MIVDGPVVQPGPIEWAVLIVTIMIVLAAEPLNTALEATLDRVSVEEHPLAKVAKTPRRVRYSSAPAGRCWSGYSSWGRTC